MKVIVLTTIILTIMTSTLPIWAQTPLIKGVRADKSEYLAYIDTHGGYGEYYKTEVYRSLPGNESIKNLRFYLRQAQESYLDNDIEGAKLHFKEVTDLALNADWEDEHRRAIYYSFLRRAQMAELSGNQDKLITQALEFESRLKPDPKLFSQRIQLAFKRIQENYKWSPWSPKNLFKNYDLVKINGKTISHSKRKILIPHGLLRVSLFSNSFQSQYIKIRGRELSDWEPPNRPLSRGDCAYGESFNSLIPVYFSKHCIYEPQKELQLSDLRPQINDSQRPTVLETPASQLSFLRNKWFWIGVGMVAFFVRNQNKEKKKKLPHQKTPQGPTHYNGF